MDSLFQPFVLGPITLRNRMVMPAMLTNFATQDGRVTRGHLEFFSKRAKGGVGMIIVEPAYVNLQGRFDKFQTAISHDTHLPGLKELAAGIKQYGAAAAVQLHHGGKNCSTALTGCQAISPSPIPAPGLDMPKAATKEELKNVVGSYRKAAQRAFSAGFDCVEISATTGGLLGQFISPAHNKREDEYGKSFKNRTRLLREVLEAVMAEVGNKMAVLCRFNSTEDPRIVNGITLEISRQVAKTVENAGVHGIHVYVDYDGAPAPITQRPLKEAALIDFTRAIKKAVNIPVIAVGRITPKKARQVIDSGTADLVAFGKALIADPDIPNKIQENRLDDIVPCIVCLRCIDAVRVEKTIECTVNPKAGHESGPDPRPSVLPKRILIAGGGPAGMTAALTAASFGHRVFLYEKTKRLGGAMKLGVIFNPELKALIDYFHREIKRSDIEVHLGKEAHTALVEKKQFDTAIIATGGKAIEADCSFDMGVKKPLSTKEFTGLLNGKIPIGRGLVETLFWKAASFFLTCFYHPSLIRFFLKFPFPVGKNLVILGGGFAGGEIGLFFAETGRNVTLLEESNTIFYDMGPTARAIYLAKVNQSCLRLLIKAKINHIMKNELQIEHEGNNESIPCSTIVIAKGLGPERTIEASILNKIPQVLVIGDCASPGKIMEAISAGYKAAVAINGK